MSKCITVSVVSHAHDSALRRLLGDLATYSYGNVLQVIVTFNIPSNSTLAWLHATDWPFDIDILINQKAQGFSKNHNNAFKLSRGDYFCVLNPDVEFDKNPFSEMMVMFLGANVGCVYPLQITTSSIPLDYKRAVPSLRYLIVRHCNLLSWLNKNPPSVWVNASFLLFSKDVYADLGGFDERYFMYCEDVDICLRLIQQGKKLIVADKAVIRHQASFSSRKKIRYFLWHITSLARLWMSPAYRGYSRSALIWQKKNKF